jgi:plasmid stabilization system protein ParE
MSNIEITFAARAQSDLRSIRRYTQAEWGEAQWTKTKARLDRAFEHLSIFPNSGVHREYKGILVRALFRGPFVILYQVGPAQVVILRIASQRELPIAREGDEEWSGDDESAIP